jgi:hypothetical protein
MARIFFFTSFSAFRSHARRYAISRVSTSSAHFRFKGNPYDNGIPARIQRRTVQFICARVPCGSAALVAGTAVAPHNGGEEFETFRRLPNASKKTH